MRTRFTLVAVGVCTVAICGPRAAVTVRAQQTPPAAQAPAPPPVEDPVRTLVGRLDLEKYKATIKGLTQFGDRRQGTDRNRAAIDWIEAQLKSYGCTNTERIKYDCPTANCRATNTTTGGGRGGGGRGGEAGRGVGGQTAGGGTGRAGAGGGGAGGTADQGRPRSRGPGVNNDPTKQPDEKLRALNTPPSEPGARDEVYCTKIGSTTPGEMYIIGAHMDGIGWGEAANDDGSGTAIVMELARIFNAPDVQTDRSIRFVLWNNEEAGLNGSRAYVQQRAPLQGKEDPPGSGKYPEPKWLGMVQHDMMMFDHGKPGPDGKVSQDQRAEADVNIEFAGTSKMAADSQTLAWAFRAANERYATDYPAAVGNRMQSTDSVPFSDHVAAISLRENERGAHIGTGWDPHWHQPTDVYSTFSDKDFRLGLNAAQTTLAAIAQLTGTKTR